MTTKAEQTPRLVGPLFTKGAGVCALLCLLTGSTAAAAVKQAPIIAAYGEERFDDGLQDGKGDFLTKVTPELGYRVFDETLKLEAKYAMDFIHHAYAAYMATDHRASGKYEQQLTERLKLRADTSLYRVQDMTSLPRLSVAQVAAGAMWIHANAGAEVRLGEADTLTVGYLNDTSRLYLPGYKLGMLHQPSLLELHRFTERFSLGAKYRYQLFLSDFVSIGQSHSATAVARYRLTRHTDVSLEGGPAVFFSRANTFEQVEPRVHGELNYAARGVEVGLNAGRDYMQAIGFGDAVWADYVQSGLAWRMSEHWSLYGGAGAFRNGLAGTQPVTAQGWGAGGGVEWRFLKGAQVQLNYDHLAQMAVGGEGLDLNRNIVGVRVGYRTP